MLHSSKSALRSSCASSRPQAVLAAHPVSSGVSRAAAFASARPAVQKLALRCQAGAAANARGEVACEASIGMSGMMMAHISRMAAGPGPAAALSALRPAAATAAAAAAAVAAAMRRWLMLTCLLPLSAHTAVCLSSAPHPTTTAAAEAEAPAAPKAGPAPGKPTLLNQPPPPTYAIIEISGKQMFVEPGKWYVTNRLKVRGCWRTWCGRSRITRQCVALWHTAVAKQRASAATGSSGPQQSLAAQPGGRSRHTQPRAE
jgi:hypothetical protein